MPRKKSQSISISKDKIDPISEKYRASWSPHRSINHRWGKVEGGYVSTVRDIPKDQAEDNEEAPNG